MRSALAPLTCVLAIASTVALAACAEQVGPPATPAGTTPPTTTTAATRPLPTTTTAASAATGTAPAGLAQSTATARPPTGALELAVSQRGLTIGGARLLPLPQPPAWIEGFAAAHKRGGGGGLFVEPLASAVSAARDGRHAAKLAVAPDVPYRVLVEVLFTLGQSEVSTVSLLVTRADGSLAAIEHEAPRAAPTDLAAQAEAMAAELAVLGGGSRPGARAAPAQPATVVLARNGVVVSAGGKRLAPGCADPGRTAGLAPGPTLARREGSDYDWAALTACAATVRDAAPADRINLTATPETDFQTLVHAIDALRPSFPRVQFAIAR